MSGNRFFGTDSLHGINSGNRVKWLNFASTGL